MATGLHVNTPPVNSSIMYYSVNSTISVLFINFEFKQYILFNTPWNQSMAAAVPYTIDALEDGERERATESDRQVVKAAIFSFIYCSAHI